MYGTQEYLELFKKVLRDSLLNLKYEILPVDDDRVCVSSTSIS